MQPEDRTFSALLEQNGDCGVVAVDGFDLESGELRLEDVIEGETESRSSEFRIPPEPGSLLTSTAWAIANVAESINAIIAAGRVEVTLIVAPLDLYR